MNVRFRNAVLGFLVTPLKRSAILGDRTGAFWFGAHSAPRRAKKAKKRKSSRARSRSHRRTKTRRTPHTAGKRRDTSHRRIRVTKNGQPYVILASGKTRFISKASAKASRKRKGGRY